MRNRLVLSTGFGLSAAMIWTAVAVAQTPAERTYGGEGGIQGEVEGGGAGVAGGVLPFTGIDLALMTLAAVLLIATGLVVRRLSRSKAAPF